MHIDKENTFTATATALTASTTSSIIDVGSVTDIGVGCPLYVYASVHTALTSGGSSTLTAVLETSSDEAFTSPVTLATTGSVAKASLVAGYTIFNQAVPQGALRYLRVKYTVGTADFTAGKVSAFLLPHQVKGDKIYRSAVPVV
jgi:hypothetical protein